MTAAKPYALVLIPSERRFDDLYNAAIKPACEAAGAYVERADDCLGNDDVLQRVHVQIAKADILVAEMTGQTEQVFYKTGFAHALNKRVVLLTHSTVDIPFDLSHYPHIIHSGRARDLQTELERWVRSLLDTSKEDTITPFIPIDVSVNGVALAAEVMSAVTNERSDQLSLGIIVRHHAMRLQKPVEFQIGLIAPSQYKLKGDAPDPKVYTERLWIASEDVKFHIWRYDFALFPGSFETIWIRSDYGQSYSANQDLGTFRIRIITMDGFRDFPFTLSMSAEPSPS